MGSVNRRGSYRGENTPRGYGSRGASPYMSSGHKKPPIDLATNFTSTGMGMSSNLPTGADVTRTNLYSPIKASNVDQLLFHSPQVQALKQSNYTNPGRPYWSSGIDKSRVLSSQDPHEVMHHATEYMTLTTQPEKQQKSVYSIPNSGRATPVRYGSTSGTPMRLQSGHNPDRIPIFRHAVEAYGFMPNSGRPPVQQNYQPSYQQMAPTPQRMVATPNRSTPMQRSYVGRPSPSISPISSGRRLPGRVVNTTRTEGQPVIVGERQLDSYEVGRNTRPSYVREVIHGQPRMIDQVISQPQNVVVTENRLPYRERRPSVVQQRVTKEVVQTVERPMILEKYIDKPFEMIIEKPVPNYLEVEVPYDVIVEKPVEKIITRDVVTDKIVEVPVEKHVEVPIERIVEVPVEKIIEQPVIYDEIVEIPVERVVEEIVETIVENPIYHDNVQEVDINDLNRYQADAILPTEVRYVEQEVKNQNYFFRLLLNNQSFMTILSNRLLRFRSNRSLNNQ